MSISEKQRAICIFGIKNCDTMKKTFAWFDQAGVAYSFVDYKKAGVVAEALPGWLAAVGWETLLNRKGLTWKKLTEAERDGVDAERAAALMQAHPTLIKRPVVVVDGQVMAGLDTAAWANTLGVSV